MKTTVDLPDDLLERAKVVAAREPTTPRLLIEEGLRWVLSQKRRKAERFVLRDGSVPGHGVNKGLTEGDWDHLPGLTRPCKAASPANP
jgi:hypothetical protein